MAIENNFKIKHGLVVSTTASIQSSTQATSTTTGALQVVGGVGIGRNLYVGGTTFLAGDLYVDGTQFSVNSTNISTGDRAIYLSTSSNTAFAATGSGLAIGPENATYASFLFDGSTSFNSSASIVPTTSTYSLGSQTLAWDTLYTKNAVISGISGYIRANNAGTLTGDALIPGTDISGAVRTATNIAGGTSGSLPYQNTSGTTAFTDIGLPGWLLSSNGNIPQWVDPASLVASSQNTFVDAVVTGTTYYLALSELSRNYSPIHSDTALSYNTTNNKLTTTRLSVSSVARASSTMTGALNVAGGMGIGGSLYAGAIYSDGVRIIPTVVQVFTATVAQTIFTVTNGYVVDNNIQVFANGILLTPSDYTASNGTSVVLKDSRDADDQITVISGQTFSATIPGVTFQYFGSDLGPVSTLNFAAGTTATLANDVLTISSTIFTGGRVTDSVNMSSTTESTSTTTGALTVAGGAGIGGNVNVGGNIEAAGNIVLNNSALVHDQSAIIVNTAIVTLDTFATTDYRSAKYVISVSNSSLGQYQTSDVSLVHNDIDSFINQTSVFSADAPLMTFTTLVSGSNVLLKGVGASVANTVKVQKIYITI